MKYEKQNIFFISDLHVGHKNWWNLPHNERIKWYYFTEKEMSEYFITQEEDYKSYRRNEKLISLGS